MRLITPASQEAIELDEAKQHLRVDHDDENMLIRGLIDAATDWAQKFTGRALVSQVWDQYLSEFPAEDGILQIKKPPLIEVIGVFYGSDDSEFSEFFVDYNTDGLSGIYVTDSTWPIVINQHNAGRIRFRAGYVDPGNSPAGEIPAAITAGMLMYLQVLYERGALDPAAQKALLETGEMLLRQYRVETAIA